MIIGPTVDSLAGFIAAIVQYCPNNLWTFRGQAEEDWPLLPKAYRNEFYLPGSTDKDDDLTRFERWCNQAIAFDLNFPSAYLERLALAQHYGLATRLLDWTANAAVALYFASEYPFAKNETNQNGTAKIKDGAVYLYRKPLKADDLLANVKTSEYLRNDRNLLFYRPRLVNRRILAQDGEFTIHPDKKHLEAQKFTQKAAKTAVEGTVIKLCVPSGKKVNLQNELRVIGIHARTLYPDLEGLAKSTNWQTNWLVLHPDIEGKKS